ncbi:hypothetical protein B0I22_1653 [Epilithonimonas xixisoli]|uniref:Uncharacterized protein n=1 Tax=Epilithonimonas xixisoli TaxID=1476462 RepID=A0A4R8I649_9FLAO|nr:hypothetical protein B0I22_1653 [Epilithonimonas xixisoli]
MSELMQKVKLSKDSEKTGAISLSIEKLVKACRIVRNGNQRKIKL